MKIRFLDTNKGNGMRQNKVLQFSAPGYETPSIPSKNPEGVKEGKRKQEVKRNSQQPGAWGGGEGAEGEDTKWVEKG